MNRWFPFIALVAATVCCFSCKNGSEHNHGPIILGDSSTIVTENDPQKLEDLVTDLKPVITHAPEPKDTVATSAQATPEQKNPDTAKKAIAAETPKQQPLPDVNGLKAVFKDVSVLIPNLNAKLAGNRDLQRANGAVYTLVSGNINNNLLRVMGTVMKVSMRYQSVIVLKDADMGVLPLDALSTTTSWEPLKGVNNTYRISGLDERSLDHADANRGTIQNAVKKAAKRRRMSHKKMEDWLDDVHNVRNAGQKPLSTTLRSVMFKIDGKDATGRQFSKQIRIDIPM